MKLEKLTPTLVGNDMRVQLTDTAGNRMDLTFTPDELEQFITKLLLCATDEPMREPGQIPTTDLSITAGVRTPGADISLSCGKVRLHFVAPLSDLFESI